MYSLRYACVTACPLFRSGHGQPPPGDHHGAHRALACSLDIAELRRAFSVISEALLVEIEWVDADLANRLAGPLRELTS